ncbi:hypothetical protein GMOD_00009169 [Pyrenophora seminiperda CCB06]|uniref:Uncharacterized protein n=1 Tax=Pyrenophora seminiperda CCB06 TaxID=1302712 RepID=A0A3M7MBE4_9PLEO|nr:hypothetical protein GMOD_00009169 [Pyrenophora seminiperda CCB06]
MTQHSRPETQNGLTLKVNYIWGKFRNEIFSQDPDGHLTPLYTMNCGFLKPQLRFTRAGDKTQVIAQGTINSFSISAVCLIHGQKLVLKPLKRWKTHYNYLSHALRGVPISWIANSSMKVWDFVCINSVTQEPIAKFAVNLWAARNVGNFYFEKSAEEVPEGLRDEVVVTGLTLMYTMTTRINNPVQLLGAAFAKPGKVEGEEGRTGMELEDREQPGKVKSS